LDWRLIGGIAIATLTEGIAGTVLSLGRGDIIGDTYATPDEFAWLDVAYIAFKLIGFAASPWLLSRFEPRRTLLVAIGAIGLACGLAAATTSLEVLVLLRAVQGSAGAVLLVAGQAILFWAYPPPRQPLLQAIFALGAVVAPATLAPALQGWLLDVRSWVWIFFAVVPLSLAAAGLILIEDSAPLPPSARRAPDWQGLILLGTALFSATYLLNQGSRWDWLEARRIGWASVVAGVTFLLYVLQHRRRGANTLLDSTVFEKGDFSFAFIVSFVAGAALFGSAYLILAFAVAVLGFTPTDAGQLLLPSGGLFAAALMLTAFLISARGMPPIATVPFGILMIMSAMWLLSGSTGESGSDDMMPAILLRGLGLGFLFLSITLIAFSSLVRSQLASGIAVFNIGRQLGGLIGVAGLQTAIDHQVAINQAALGAAVTPGSIMVAGRLASTTALFIERGIETGPASKAATALLGRAVFGQAVVIAFDTAFIMVALLFIVAAPILILVKIAFARMAARGRSRSPEAHS
jgi:DHA2 family multidrug resistance protein